MATCGGSSDVSSGYIARSMSAPGTHVSINSSPEETSPLEDAPLYRFTGIPDLRKRVDSQSNALVAGRTTQQYLIFRGVTNDNLARIDRQRTRIGKHTRMTHYTDTNLLVIKLMPSGEHQAAHLTLAAEVDDKLREMGLPKRSLTPLGGTRYAGTNSSKEGDSTYKPKSRSQKDDWPIIVFEAGLSESLTGLRRDAQWWLINSGGEVKIAIVISIVLVEKSLRIEKWCLSTPPRRATRAYSNTNTLVLMKMQELTITQDPLIPPLPGIIPTYTVTGAPLTLEFEKLLRRAPLLPEGDVIFTTADLRAWAGDFWSAFR